MASRPEKLREVSATRPCPVCGGDHKCSTGSAGLIICGRQAGAVPGFTHLGPSKDPQFHLYRAESDQITQPPKKRKPKPTNWATAAAKYAALIDDPDNGKPRLKLARSLGIPPAVIDMFTDLGVSPNDPDGACWTLPERDGDGQIVGINRRYITGKKKAVHGGNRGLTILEGWRDRPGPVLLVEGASDTLALTAAGLSAIGRPNNTGGADYLTTLLAGWPADRGIIVVGENDKKPDGRWPGKEGAEQTANTLAHKLNRVIGVAMPPDGSKDVRDWLVKRAADGTWAECGQHLIDSMKVKNFDPPKDIDQFALTDYGNAQRLVRRHGQDIRFCNSQWFIWDGYRWRADRTGEVIRRAKSTVRRIVVEVSADAPKDIRQAYYRHALASESNRAIRDMIKLSESEPGIGAEPSDMDSDPFLFNCTNGTVCLKTGELLPHRRENLLTKMAAVEYDPDAECPIWEKFLGRVFSSNPEDPEAPGDSELISFWRRLLGYCLTGDIREQIIPVLWGGGSNGKSTLINVVRAILGKGYFAKAPRGLLMARKTDSHPTELTVLDGARLVVATESAQDQRLSEDLVKDLTGGEVITARRMKQDFYEFEPTHKLMLCTNHRPRISETDDGIWRRVILVPFLVKFWNPDKGEIGPEHLRQDKTLLDQMKGELPGILAWMVRGCLEWQVDGLKAPKVIQEKTAEYRKDEDQVESFLADRCTISNAAGDTPLTQVYAKFVEWCESNGYRAGSNRRLKASLIGHGIKVENGTGNRVTCFGLALKDGEKTGSLENWHDP